MMLRRVPVRRAAVRLAPFGLALAAFLFGTAFGRQSGSRGPLLFEEVFRLIQGRALDSVPPDSIYSMAARGLVSELGDPYAALWTPKESNDYLRNGIGDAYGGLGMGIESRGGDFVNVSDVFAGSPAARGGVKRGDEIVSIDGVSAKGWTTDKVSQHLTGVVGTPVRVTVSRMGVADPVTTSFVRARVHAPAVPFTLLLQDGVGYVPLTRFNGTSSGEVLNAIQGLQAAGAKRVVLDLRGNGGGEVDQAIAVANVFLARGATVATQRERGVPERVYRADADPAVPRLPLAVLVDGSTASASEIVAGALQDHDRGVIVGSRSFGKGLVQSMFQLDDGYVMKLTTGRWYTPSGRSIHRDRKIVGGELVLADSGPNHNALPGAPAARSDRGRLLTASGGITPDVEVSDDTLSAQARAFFRDMAPYSAAYRDVLFATAREQAVHADTGFVMTDAVRRSMWARLAARGARLPQDEIDAAAPYVDRTVIDETLRLAFGDSAVARREQPRDAALQHALKLLRDTDSEPQVLARVKT